MLDPGRAAKLKEAEFIAKLSKKPPEGCDFRVGDTVSYINEFGVTFDDRAVVGFSDPDKHGRCVHLSNEAYWFPVEPSSLKLTHRPKPVQRPKL